MPLHWIYDQQAVEAKVKAALHFEKKGPEFYSPPSCPFYNYTHGRQSPYGDEVIPIMLSLTEKGHFDIDHCRETSYKFCKSYNGRLNRVMRRFLESRNADKDWTDCAVDDDTQFLALMKVPIVVARYAGSPMLIDKLEAIVKIHQTNEKVIASARFVARLLEKIVLGFTATEALSWAKSSPDFSAEEKEILEEIETKADIPYSKAAEMAGLNGQLPGCLKASLYAIKILRGYEMAVRVNIVAAGDNVARAWLLGSFLAAEQGTHVIPVAWREETAMFDKILQLTDMLVEANKALETTVEKGCSLPGFS